MKVDFLKGDLKGNREQGSSQKCPEEKEVGSLTQESCRSFQKLRSSPGGSQAPPLPNIALSNCKSLQWTTPFSKGQTS